MYCVISVKKSVGAPKTGPVYAGLCSVRACGRNASVFRGMLVVLARQSNV